MDKFYNMVKYKKYQSILVIIIVFFACFLFVQNVNADTYDAKPYFSSTGDCAGTTRAAVGVANSCRRSGYSDNASTIYWGDDDQWTLSSTNRMGAGYFDTSAVPSNAQIEAGSYIKFRIQDNGGFDAGSDSVSFYIIDSSEDADWDSNGPSNAQVDAWIVDFTIGASTNGTIGNWIQFNLTQGQMDALELHLANGGVTYKLKCTNCSTADQISYDTGFYTSIESYSPLFHIVYTTCSDNGVSCSVNGDCCSGNCQDTVCCASGKVGNGSSCSVGTDCCSGNCQNSVCCTSGQTCCSSDSNCPADSFSNCIFTNNYCDTVTDHYCKSSNETWCFRINSGQTEVIAIHGDECNVTKNNNASDIFVPTKTANEWSAFKDNATGVSICKDCDNDGYGECPACGIANGCTYDGDDCCDSDNRAYPGESTYYVSTNNCSSWDYDCSGTTNQSNCTYNTVSLSGDSWSCYWTSTCLAGTKTGYIDCTATGHTASCGQTNNHYSCTNGTCYRKIGDPFVCDSGPAVHSSTWSSRTCTCK